MFKNKRNHFDYIATAAVICMLISFLALIGWAFDIETLKSGLPGYITMKVNTAILFGLMALTLLTVRKKSPSLLYLPALFSVLVILASSATLAEYLMSIDLGIDQIFVKDWQGVGGRFPPGRLAPITALNFIFLSLSFLIDYFRGRRAAVLSQLCAALVLFASVQGLVGYVIGLTYLFGSAFYTQMAIHTALAFSLLASAKLLLHRDRGFVQSFTAKSPTARMTRWMLIMAAFVPPLVKWVGQLGLNAGLYDQDFSQLIQIFGITALMAVLIVTAGGALFRTELERMKRQVELLESEEKFRVLVETTAQIVWTANSAGARVEDSPSWRAFTGQTVAQWQDGGWRQAIHPDDREKVLKKWQEAVHLQSHYEVEYRLIHHASQTWRWTLARATPLLSEKGEPRGWIGMNSDIHERKMIEIDLKKAKEEAERANQLKSAFLANMSHEIRTPLGAMIGFADILRDADVSGPERSEYLDVIMRNGEQLAVLINDILDLSKVEAGHLTLEYGPCRIREVLAEVAALFKLKAHQKGLQIIFEVDPSAPDEIRSDRLRMKQILVNIIGNAIKFTSSGRVHIKAQAWISADGRQGLAFEIEDTGIGISPSQLESVFDVFVQADGSVTRRFGGTGLGLSLSRKLARALGGDVTVQKSVEGQGTVFLVKLSSPALDLAQETRPATARSSSSRGLALAGLYILVVDDAPDNQQLIRHNLIKRGATVDSAENGLLGLQRALAAPYDIILMDIQMEIMDGYTATRKLREAGFAKPIIALTAHAMREVRKRCLDVGCNDHLAKPIDFTDLTTVIVRYTAH